MPALYFNFDRPLELLPWYVVFLYGLPSAAQKHYAPLYWKIRYISYSSLHSIFHAASVSGWWAAARSSVPWR